MLAEAGKKKPQTNKKRHVIMPEGSLLLYLMWMESVFPFQYVMEEHRWEEISEEVYRGEGGT